MMDQLQEIVLCFLIILNLDHLTELHGDAHKLIQMVHMLLSCVHIGEALAVQTRTSTSTLIKMMEPSILLACKKESHALITLNQFVVLLHSTLITQLMSLFSTLSGNKTPSLP